MCKAPLPSPQKGETHKTLFYNKLCIKYLQLLPLGERGGYNAWSAQLIMNSIYFYNFVTPKLPTIQVRKGRLIREVYRKKFFRNANITVKNCRAVLANHHLEKIFAPNL